MAVPVLLIAGFLGSGKTTLLNRLLANPEGRRIAAVVNDFGAIDIEAMLLADVSQDAVSLKNGCICCTLQGDLLRTLANVMRRPEAPDLIVIETSGIADPAEIVRSLLDPVIFKVAALDTVVTLIDAADVDARADDPLWQSQARAADFLILNKVDLVDDATRARLHGQLSRWKPARAIFDAVRSEIPMDLLVSNGDGYEPTSPRLERSMPSSPQFETLSWTSTMPLSLAGFQSVVAQLAPRVLRAKGILSFAERPGDTMQFQLVGSRATVTPCSVLPDDGLAVRLVLIFRSMEADPADLTRLLDEAIARP